MDADVFFIGLREICDFFGDDYNPDAVKIVEPAILLEPAIAMHGALARIKTEFPPKFLPPIAKIRDIILQEGKKIREEETGKIEQESAVMKREESGAWGEPATVYGKSCVKFLRAAFSGLYDKAELREMAIKGQARFPGTGFDAWVNGALAENETERMRLAAGDSP